MPKLWFTSDQHFDHANILEYCTGRAKLWSDVPSMNRGLLERFNDTVGDDDYVIHMGDFGMGKRSESVAWNKWMRGRWHALIPGNHDNCFEHGRDGHGTGPKSYRHISDYYKWGRFNHIHPHSPVVCGALLPNLDPLIHNALLSHLPPLECDNHPEEARFKDIRPTYPPDDTWMLCGHVHEAFKVHGRVINVGVDVWDYAPVSADTLVALMRKEGNS